jgi:Ferredoxin thioredoxin reductase variable alpha chain
MTVVLSEVIREREAMKVGDRVRVSTSVVVYHHPQHKKEPFDLKGTEGTIVGIITEWEGRPISANLPVLVEFSPKFKSHFRESELEVISP